MKNLKRLFCVLTAGLALGSAHSLTLLPEGEIVTGRVFDHSSPRSQKMQSVLCFGRDKAACQNTPARYWGARLYCEWPYLFAERVVPENMPEQKRFPLPVTSLPVGAQTQGQQCWVSLQVELPPFMTSTKDSDDLMAYIDWEFEKEIPPGFKAGKREGDKRIVLPYFLNTKRDGEHLKHSWSGRRLDYKNASEFRFLPARTHAPAQNSWMSVIINGEVIEKLEVRWSEEAVKWTMYDWRKKSGQSFQRSHGGR